MQKRKFAEWEKEMLDIYMDRFGRVSEEDKAWMKGRSLERIRCVFEVFDLTEAMESKEIGNLLHLLPYMHRIRRTEAYWGKQHEYGVLWFGEEVVHIVDKPDIQKEIHEYWKKKTGEEILNCGYYPVDEEMWEIVKKHRPYERLFNSENAIVFYHERY